VGYCTDVLNHFMYLPPPIEEGPLVAAMSDACRIAAAVLCFLPFRTEYPSPMLMFNAQLHKLITALEVVFDLVPPGHLLLPWLLMVGGIYAVQPERAWFVGHLATVADDLNIWSWEEMKPHVTKVIWVEIFCNDPFRELWDEVVRKREKLGLLDLDPWQ